MEREDNRAQWKETERSNVGDIKILSIRITNCMDSQTVHKSVGNRTRKSKPIYYRLSNKKVTCNVCVMCTTVINSTCRTDLELYCVNSFFFLSLSLTNRIPKQSGAKWHRFFFCLRHPSQCLVMVSRHVCSISTFARRSPVTILRLFPMHSLSFQIKKCVCPVHHCY